MRARKEETKNSFHTRLNMEHPTSAIVQPSLSNGRSFGRSMKFAEQMFEGFGYKGKRPESGRPAGTRIVSQIINGEEVFYAE